MGTKRSVTDVITSHRQREGGGFIVRRPIPTYGVDQVDPFLLLDEMGPAVYGPGEAVGAPDHPHRGFETVTYMLDGAFEHKDSAGHSGRLSAGDVQWMTAGAGIVHSEMPSEEIRRDGGRVHGFQLWVNLPREHKMMKPRYQERKAAEIPKATSDDGKAQVVVIAGEALGVEAGIDTVTPITYQHWTLQPEATVTTGVPVEQQGNVYVFVGRMQVAGQWIEEGQMASLSAGDTVELATGEQAAQALLLAGKPLGEPMARHGPFVMNTVGEIRQAMLDYHLGKMGSIAADQV